MIKKLTDIALIIKSKWLILASVLVICFFAGSLFSPKIIVAQLYCDDNGGTPCPPDMGSGDGCGWYCVPNESCQRHTCGGHETLPNTVKVRMWDSNGGKWAKSSDQCSPPAVDYSDGVNVVVNKTNKESNPWNCDSNGPFFAFTADSYASSQFIISPPTGGKTDEVKINVPDYGCVIYKRSSPDTCFTDASCSYPTAPDNCSLLRSNIVSADWSVSTTAVTVNAPHFVASGTLDVHIIPPVPTATPVPTVPAPTATTAPAAPTNTPTPTTPASEKPTLTPIPSPSTTPPVTTDNPYSIAIGTKQSLTINIGGGADPNNVHVRFGVKLETAQTKPEIMVRLKAVDLSVSPTPVPSDACQTPGAGQYFYKDIPMVADSSDTYYPKPNAAFSDIYGTTLITSDGWVPLRDLTPSKSYALFVKGPKHRDIKTIDNVTLRSAKAESQNFDWTTKLLEAGDLPDPNHNSLQDCVVNSIDLSLVVDRIGKTDEGALKVADVNYDLVVNANDVAKVVNTLKENDGDDY